MKEGEPEITNSDRRPIRWWPGVSIVLATIGAVLWVWFQEDWPFQKRNLVTAQLLIVAVISLVVWWSFLSRAQKRLRLSVFFGSIAAVVLLAALFRVRGVTGDLVPILEVRWAKHTVPAVAFTNVPIAVRPANASTLPPFPQFLGPNRNGVLPGPRLATNWTTQQPTIVWRQRIGAGWSGFSIVEGHAITQEQRGDNECVVAYDVATGGQFWLHSDPTHYHNPVAGEGPRATPTVEGNRVFALGGNGLLNCLSLATGQRHWSRELAAESGGAKWGFASSPLLVDGLVIVHGGEGGQRSIYAFHAEDGRPAWTGGSATPSYASLSLAMLAGVRQVLAFNHGSISAHDPGTGATLWERPWGNGNAVCSSPVVVGDNRVVFSSGYGVGAELIEVTAGTNAGLSVRSVWKSLRMKAKFAHLFARDGCLFGLDDGVFACVNLADGSLKWKEGRYGHGQGLLIGGDYVLMAESGELVLLRPTPVAPNELSLFRVFDSKTWNPIALAGDLLFVRNDLEAACVRLPTEP